jgi:hypothetical protein
VGPVGFPAVLPHVTATRYVAPLREGGSLPGLVEADDLGTYVAKFRGAGQGLKVLVAEVVVGELARHLGLRVPALVALTLDEVIAKYEKDEEVQDLLQASIGLNLGVDFLPGSFGYDGRSFEVAPDDGVRVLWLDAFTANVDRTWRNPNLLVWHRQLWCYDHGAALYFHHSWERSTPDRFAAQPYRADDHVLARLAGEVAAADEGLAALVTSSALDVALSAVPDEWLEPAPGQATPDEVRSLYHDHLAARLAPPRRWLP